MEYGGFNFRSPSGPPYFLPWTIIACRVSDHALNDGTSNCIEILEPIMESIQGLGEFRASLFDLLYQAHPPLSNHRRSGTMLVGSPDEYSSPRIKWGSKYCIAPSALFLVTSTPIVWRSRKLIRKKDYPTLGRPSIIVQTIVSPS